MKGILLAGGQGSRLKPMTTYLSKQLLPVYDKPMFYYSLSILLLAGVREVLIISDPSNIGFYKNNIESGEHLGINVSYLIQEKPNGIAQSFLIGEEFIGGEKCALVLGDNIMYGAGLGRSLKSFADIEGAHIFACEVQNPSDYGIVEIDTAGKILSIEEKPLYPKSNLAVPGLYFYDETVVELSKNLGPSNRGELEITDLNKLYLEQNKLNVSILPRGTAWLDAGTPKSLLDASNFIRLVEERQGIQIGFLEEISWRNKWISDDDLITEVQKRYSQDLQRYAARLVDKK